MRPVQSLLLVSSVVVAACSGNGRADLVLELEWKRSVYGPTLLESASGLVVLGQGSGPGLTFSVFAPSDDFLVAPLCEVTLTSGVMTVGVFLSATRAVFSQSDLAGIVATDAVVVDLTSGSPPITRSMRLPPGTVPLAADGRWLLSTYLGHDGQQRFLELIDLDDPSSQFSHPVPGQPGLAIVAQAHMLVFVAGYGWVRVSPELAAAGQGFEEKASPELTEVFDAIVEGDEVLLASVHDSSSQASQWIRIARHELLDGWPQWPSKKATEFELPKHNLRFVWDGRGTGVLGGMDYVESVIVCSGLDSCYVTTTPAYLIEEGDDAFHARPVLLPYLDFGVGSYDGLRGTHTMAVRGGRLLTFQGDPYELAWYRIDLSAP